MPATPERAAFAAEEFRSRTWESEDVREQYGRVARDTEDLPFESYFDEPNHAQIMLNERGRLIGGHARRFRTTVDKLLLADDLDLSSIAPSVILVDDDLVVDDLYAAVVGIDGVDFETGRTTLSLWGLIGDLPVTVQSGVMRAAGTTSFEAIQAVTRSSVMAAAGVGAGSGAGGSVKNAALASTSAAAMAAAGTQIGAGAMSAAAAAAMQLEGVEATDTSGRFETTAAGAAALAGFSVAEAVLSAAGVAALEGIHSAGNRRITQSGDVRITMGGDTRILED